MAPQFGFGWGGPVSVVWGFVGVVIWSSFLALSLAEISSQYTVAGGPYYWAGALRLGRALSRRSPRDGKSLRPPLLTTPPARREGTRCPRRQAGPSTFLHAGMGPVPILYRGNSQL